MLLNTTKKMHARRNPNLSVTATAYSQLSPPVHSASLLSPTAASRRGLLSPPGPLSPSLPSLIPRHGKKQPSCSHSGLVKRSVLVIVGTALALWLVLHLMSERRTSQGLDFESSDEWEMVGGNSLPQEPSAIIVQDVKGNPKWTVSIPPSYGFPLRPAHYQEICQQSMELSKQLRQEGRASNSMVKRMLGYYTKDQYFMDVAEAEEQGLLPSSKANGRPKGFVDDEDMVAKRPQKEEEMKVCERSLTYVMETTDAGMGTTLMRLWMSYGLALKENRAFFVDDTRWPYGKYLTYFLPPPPTHCLPPPASHMLPCPHTAHHIIVSSATVRQTFGHAFSEEFEDARKMRVQRQVKIFGLLRTGYEALFKLRQDDAEYVGNRTQALYADVRKQGGKSVGVHIRRGDKHPFEYQFQKDYIPVDRYMAAAQELARSKPRKIVIASDDPQMYESPDLLPGTVRAQDRIMLATKSALEAAHWGQKKENPWIDDLTGWEGGFFKDVFFSLGRDGRSRAGSRAAGVEEEVPEQAMRLRELVGRAYLMDLAVLMQADGVVCGVSAVGCRILAVGMGWEKAIGRGDGGGTWRNVDGLFEWKGIIW
ncbi:uncharacterized protein EI97DRAFT_471974 [Westerdykella ornata]|uniref:Uncharacterized protein n=1 Tax=Westerdykella ornata TaxID=318751 RepID=A0A6A6JYS4_WESOR|nr:uncharacterized protein EI97DRAFT_471974 [Westerdykella ornata]KAF2280906.1 hypothetical protein EI97DRAFT_471974 [Westerdykella ornata]